MNQPLKSSLLLLLISALPVCLFGAHANQGEQDEHDLAMMLADPADATHTATQNGDWTTPATWGGVAPTASARVHIPAGIAVTVDSVVPDTFRTIRLDGTLDFATNVNTELKFDTLVASPSSVFEMGTSVSPIQSSVTAKVIVEDIGAFEVSNNTSPDYDPGRVGLGLILHGQVSMHGMEREGSASFIGANSGDTLIQLDRLPSNWAIGDEIVIANAKPDATGDELRTITALDSVNHTLTVDSPLAEDHVTPRHTVSGLTLRLHIINLTRNVILETINNANRTTVEAIATGGSPATADEFTKRGHVMFMHSNNVNIRYAKFEGLGRTNKNDNTLQNAIVTMPGPVVTQVAANPIARYPLHFHRAGDSTSLASVEGCVVRDSPGWGYVNHSSAAAINYNVAYEVTGAAFVSEAGDEVGEFIGNVAVKMHDAYLHMMETSGTLGRAPKEVKMERWLE